VHNAQRPMVPFDKTRSASRTRFTLDHSPSNEPCRQQHEERPQGPMVNLPTVASQVPTTTKPKGIGRGRQSVLNGLKDVVDHRTSTEPSTAVVPVVKNLRQTSVVVIVLPVVDQSWGDVVRLFASMRVNQGRTAQENVKTARKLVLALNRKISYLDTVISGAAAVLPHDRPIDALKMILQSERIPRKSATEFACDVVGCLLAIYKFMGVGAALCDGDHGHPFPLYFGVQ